MTFLIPAFFSLLIACPEFSRNTSTIAMRPKMRSSSPSIITVFPSFCRRETLFSTLFTSIACSVKNLELPITASNADILDISAPRSFAYFTIASARECSDRLSIANAIAKNSLSDMPSVGMISVTCGFPSVRVPVLSKATTDKLPASSRYLPPLISTPFFAALPIADTMETGVDITSAQGHPTNSIAMAS